jgi:1-aminocyclopropane-1-carboxylate deaminase/D-cysteine desulfhydrase-like pyridoxal-dependent ACC family enzyme
VDIPPEIAALPRFPLIDGPSPLRRLQGLEAQLGRNAEIWIKREDLLPLAFGGNKLRNLEFLVGAALAAGADCLVTSGRRWSNHCRLTAAAGARAGLDVHLVINGPRLEPPGPNVVLDELLGATVHVAATDDRRDREALVDSVAADLRSAGRQPFVIEVGGSGPVGAAGQVLAGLETVDQLAEAGVGEMTILLPSATGGTQSGLLTAMALTSPPSRGVLGVVVGQPAASLGPVIQRLLAGLAPLAGVSVPSEAIRFDESQLGGGYGEPTAAAADAARLLARTEGILVDPIYTAKALAALIAGVRDGRLSGSIVFWHAGGTPGLFEGL